MTRRCPSSAAGLLAIGLAIGLLCENAAAQQAVQLSGVPEDLSFPLPAGRNVVLTAEVEGAEPRAVWLARDKDARVRCMLSRVGAGRYQVNLADADVAAVLGSGGDGFQVFAELPDGTVLPSIAVRYATAPRVHGPPRVFVLLDGQRREVLRDLQGDAFWEPALRARLTGQSVVLSGEGFSELIAAAGQAGTYWCPPEKLQKVQLEFQAEAARPAAEVRAGGKAWQAEAAGRPGALALSITPEVRLAWEQGEALQVLCTEAGAEVLQLSLRAPPSRLDLPGDRAEVTIEQRTSKAVPGSDGYMAVRIDDITGGLVRLSLATADGERLIDEKVVREGDAVRFATRDALYTLSVERLVNLLVGDDYALLSIGRASRETEEAEQKRIRGLLDALAKAEAVFVSEKEEIPAARMAAVLRERLDRGAARTPTLMQFIERVASRSAETGMEYQVRPAGGERIRARTWLDGLAASLFPEPSGTAPARAWAEALEKPGLPNLHRVAKTVYRGGQPTAEGIRELKAMGVKTIINLRGLHSDGDLLEGKGLDCVEIPCHAWHPEEEDVVEFLKAISDEAKGPFFVHCHHGSDRTGMMIAIYRVVLEGWSKAEAIDEMTKGDFGFNPIWSDLKTFVQDLDVESVRRKAGLPAAR